MANSNKEIEGKRRGELEAIERKYRNELAAEKARQQEQVCQIMQEKWETIGVLTSGIARFRDLLMEIGRNTSLIRQETDSASSNYQRLLNIERLLVTGNEVSRQLNSYASARPLKVRFVDLNRLLREFFDAIGTAKIRIQQELAADLYPIVVDKMLIDRALVELFFNAVETMSGSGDLLFKTMNATHEALEDLPILAEPGDYVLLTVVYTGVNMDKKTMEHVFDPFFTTKEIGRETGLRLTIVRAIIKNHGGFMTVSSEEGVGTTFNIYLPATSAKEAYSEVFERQRNGPFR